MKTFGNFVENNEYTDIEPTKNETAGQNALG